MKDERKITKKPKKKGFQSKKTKTNQTKKKKNEEGRTLGLHSNENLISLFSFQLFASFI